ncbi:MAG: response regulator transcription factor [Bryobacteraceae bacterium]
MLIADDHTLVAEGLAKLLEKDYDVLATVDNGNDLIAAARQNPPDLALIDVSMPELTGVEAARKLTEIAPGCKIICVTMHSNPEFVLEAFRAGASGYVLKRSAASELSEAIRQVMNGNAYVSPLLTKDVLSILLQPRTPALTTRQREILRFVAQGLSAKEIANRLNISVKTAHFHKTSIMEKLNLHTTAELTKYALEHGIVS